MTICSDIILWSRTPDDVNILRVYSWLSINFIGKSRSFISVNKSTSSCSVVIERVLLIAPAMLGYVNRKSPAEISDVFDVVLKNQASEI